MKPFIALLALMLIVCSGCQRRTPPPCKPCYDCRHVSESTIVGGQMRCQHCGRTMIGEQVATVWFGEGQPISVLCRRCDKSLSGQQREVYLRRWYQAQPAEYRLEHLDEFRGLVGSTITTEANP